MSRLQHLLDNRAVNFIARLRADVDAYKTKQFAGGFSTYFKISQTYNPAGDINVSIPAFTTKNFRITFTPETASKVLAQISLGWSYVGSSIAPTLGISPDPANLTSDPFRSWITSITSNDATTITASAVIEVKAIDVGTITVVAI